MAITDLDPRLLVEAHNDGDDDAFAQIVRSHHQGLFAHALSRLHEVQAAEDAVQETFIRAYRAMPRFQGDFHLRAWLHRILTNVCHDEGSRRQRDGLLFEKVSSQAVPGGDAADADIERVDLSRDVVATALAALPVSYREALVLRYVDDLTYEEVAAATGVTTGNARVRVMRGRVALKRALTSSHALIIGLLPWLRRGGRGPTAVAELQSIGAASVQASAPSVLASAPGLLASSPNLLASSPLLLRAVDTAPQLAERMATLPQVLGLVATLAVPIAAPVVSDQVADWVAGPPAISAAPAADDVQVAAAEGPAGDGGGGAQVPATPSGGVAPTHAGPGTVGATPSNAVLAGGAGVLSGAAAATATSSTTATSAPPLTTTTTAPGPVSSTTVSTSTTVPTSTTVVTAPITVTVTAPTRTLAPTPVPVVVPGGKDAVGTPPPAPIVLAATLAGDKITSVGDKRVDLTGPVTWGVGGDGGLAGELQGTLHFSRVRNVGVPSKDTTAPKQGIPAAGTRTFSGELALSLGDGRTYRLVLSDGVLGDHAAGSTMHAGFELFDPCDGRVASGFVDGNLDLQEAPVPSALALAFAGEGPGVAPVCD